MQQGPVAAHQLLQPLAPLGQRRLQAAAQGRQLLAGPIRHPAALLQAVVQALLQLRQGAQLAHQLGADRSQLRIVDLTPQPPRRRQGAGQGQQLLATGAAALGAQGHRGADVHRPQETEAALDQPIETQQLGGFGQQPLTGAEIGRQGQGAAVATTGVGAGKAGKVGRQPRPLQQLEGFGGDGGITHQR